MTRFNSTATRSNVAERIARRNSSDFFASAPTRFKVMRIVSISFISLVFLAMLTFVVLYFTGSIDFPFNYSYSVSYGDGGYSYEESYSVK